MMMNNDKDKLRAEMQAKMQTMTDELHSQLGISDQDRCRDTMKEGAVDNDTCGTTQNKEG